MRENLYVGRLPTATEAELRDLFEAHGAVGRITLAVDRATGRCRGFGFVEMTDASEADKAIRGAQPHRSRPPHVDHQ